MQLLPARQQADDVMADGTPQSSVILRTCTLADLWLVCRNMRQYDVDEFMADSGAEQWNFETAAIALANKRGVRFCLALPNGDPLACGGFDEMTPGNWQSWLIGTEDGWRGHWRSITKATIGAFDSLFASGARRVQVNTLESRSEAIRWYTQSLHMTHEGVWRGYGANGENFAQFAVLKQEWDHGRRR